MLEQRAHLGRARARVRVRVLLEAAHAAEAARLDRVVQRGQPALVEPVQAAAGQLRLTGGVGSRARLQQGEHARLVPLPRRPRDRGARALVERAQLRPALDQLPHLQGQGARIGGLGGGGLEQPRRWLAAWWACLSLGVPGGLEPPGAP